MVLYWFYMLDRLYHRFSLWIFLFFLSLAILFFPLSVHAQLPFGGPIIWVTTCNKGFWVLLGPPVAGQYFVNYGASTYLNGPPTHPGQFLLGMATGYQPCVIGPYTIGGGLMILYHGSSV